MNPTRRDLLIAFGTTGLLTPALAQHVHQAVTEVKSLDGGAAYKPKLLTAHEFSTLRRLSDLIIPSDEHSKGALDAGAAEFIDFLCSRNEQLAGTYTGGLAWIDAAMQRRFRANFIDAKPAEQTALLDIIAFRKNWTPELAPGIHFFDWCRRMTMDAYYTSPAGMNDIGFMGNQVLGSFSVPQEAVDYAIKRSPFA